MTNDRQLFWECKRDAIDMRKDIIQMTFSSKQVGAHIGGSLSMVEIVLVLYKLIMQVTPQNFQCDQRDRFILSKGHGVMAQYAALKQVGILNDEDLKEFKKNESILSAHPSLNASIGIECSSGSLGMGLSFGVGVALALKKKNIPSQVYVLLGDGECDEGSVWEAASAASHFRLNNLTAIIDKNRLQYDGLTDEILSLSNIDEKWKAFGWETYSVDGHSVEELYEALQTQHSFPKVVIANTIKGKGVSLMENEQEWHNNRLNLKQYEKAMCEQEEAYSELFQSQY